MDILSLLIATPIGTHAFWGWMMVGLILLGLEMLLGTQWLLWSAASAALVAIITLTGLPVGIITQIVLFAALSLGSALMSRKLMKPVSNHDVNDQHLRMVGQSARVLSGFEVRDASDRIGRVAFDGVEWPAVLEADADAVGEVKPDMAVRILKVKEGKLYIKP